jgi:hypothetical protein
MHIHIFVKIGSGIEKLIRGGGVGSKDAQTAQ